MESVECPGDDRHIPGRGNGNEIRVRPDCTPTKVCTKCEAEKPATPEFWQRRRAGRGGLSAHCKACDQKAEQDYRESRLLQSVRERREEIADRKRRGIWVCSVCHEEKPLVEFYFRGSACSTTRCKACYYATKRIYYHVWRKKNPELMGGYQASYAATDKGKMGKRLKNHKRRVRIGDSGFVLTRADVAAQLARQAGRCFWCKAKVGEDYHVDHVIPLALGGSNGPENIVISCPHCNTSKAAKHPMDWSSTLC